MSGGVPYPQCSAAKINGIAITKDVDPLETHRSNFVSRRIKFLWISIDKGVRSGVKLEPLIRQPVCQAFNRMLLIVDQDIGEAVIIPDVI